MNENQLRLLMEWQDQLKKWPQLRERGWKLVLDTRARQRLGVCKYHQKEIGISAWHAEVGEWSDVRDTLLHEIAHALAPIGAGHGYEWRVWCRRVGALAERCAPAETSRREATMRHAARAARKNTNQI